MSPVSGAGLSSGGSGEIHVTGPSCPVYTGGPTAEARAGDHREAALDAVVLVRIAIDDFGCGFSSLSTLARLPVDILKIDRSFVSDQSVGKPSVRMLEGILGLAEKLSLSVIAEGIEEPAQLDLLRELGCSMGQGYLLGRPIDAIDFTRQLRSGRPRDWNLSYSFSEAGAPGRSEESV